MENNNTKFNLDTGIEIENLKDYTEIEELLYYLNTLTKEELAEINFKDELNGYPNKLLFTAMAYLAAGKSSTEFNSLYQDETFGLILDDTLDNTVLEIGRDVSYYILKLHNVYLNKYDSENASLQNSSDFKFKKYPDNLNSITYTNGWIASQYQTTPNLLMPSTLTRYKLEINRIENIIHVNTYTWIQRKTEKYEELIEYENVQLLATPNTELRLKIRPPFLDSSNVQLIKQMFEEANLNIKPEAKRWLMNWIFEAIDHREDSRIAYRADYELEALCSLLELDYIKTHAKFSLLNDMSLLTYANIDSFVESLFLDNSYSISTYDLPHIE